MTFYDENGAKKPISAYTALMMNVSLSMNEMAEDMHGVSFNREAWLKKWGIYRVEASD